MRSRILQILLACLVFIFLKASPAYAQYKIRGTVYDSTKNYAVPFVTVMSTSGTGTTTNIYGEYEIEVAEKDSIWFSYLNKPTVKFPVLKIANPLSFDISLQVNVPVLNEVKVRPRNYRLDSLQNRADYEKIFNYKKPGLKVVTPQYGAGAGFDVNEIINAFRFRRNRNLRNFQERLITQEQEKYVDHRFSKAVVRRLTGLTGNELDSFMTLYRPPYFYVAITSDYELQKYIKDSFERHKKGLPPEILWREEDPEN